MLNNGQGHFLGTGRCADNAALVTLTLGNEIAVDASGFLLMPR
jgi:hypothetical protein